MTGLRKMRRGGSWKEELIRAFSGQMPEGRLGAQGYTFSDETPEDDYGQSVECNSSHNNCQDNPDPFHL
jgi:hypothetical protein